MSELPRQSDVTVRAELRHHDEEGRPTGPVLGAIVVMVGPPAVLQIVLPDGSAIFSAPLELLAWQLCIMEPRLSQFLVVRDD